MRRFLFAVMVVGLTLNAGVSFAREDNVAKMPEKVRNKLERYVGRWNVAVGDNQIGEAVFRWAPGNHYIIMDQLLDVGNGGIAVTGLLSWDGLSKNGTTRERKSHGEWSIESTEISADGTKTEYVGTSVFSEDGKTWTVKFGRVGTDKNEWASEVWHRLSK